MQAQCTCGQLKGAVCVVLAVVSAKIGWVLISFHGMRSQGVLAYEAEHSSSSGAYQWRANPACRRNNLDQARPIPRRLACPPQQSGCAGHSAAGRCSRHRSCRRQEVRSHRLLKLQHTMKGYGRSSARSGRSVAAAAQVAPRLCNPNACLPLTSVQPSTPHLVLHAARGGDQSEAVIAKTGQQPGYPIADESCGACAATRPCLNPENPAQVRTDQ